MSTSQYQPPIPDPVTDEDRSDNPDNPDVPDPDQDETLPPVGDASGLRGESAGRGEDTADDAGAAAGTDEDSPRPADVDTQDPDAQGAEIGMTEGEGSTFEPEEDPEGHR